MTEEKKFHYLHVNRGRYICHEHGGFCDQSDNYSSFCPLCKIGKKPIEINSQWQPNNIDRALQIVNGLQKRSQRNLAIVASFVGGIGALRLFTVLFGTEDANSISQWPYILVLFGIIFFLIALVSYANSMKHIGAVNSDRFSSKSLSDWECYMAKKLAKLEEAHAWAGFWLGVGVSSLICGLIIVTIQSLMALICH